jgi:hypothetical protein
VIVLAVAALGLAQLHAWLAGWAGPALPDPFPLLVALVGLCWPRNSLAWAVLVLGWSRALCLAEPVGGHVLAAGAAVALLASQRHALDARRAGTLLACGLLAAAALALAGWLLRAASGAPLTAGWALAGGALLALPLLAPLRAAATGLRRRRA